MRLDETQRRRIEAAVAEAERGTSGEIVVVVAPRASAYRSTHLALALAVALLAPWPLLALTQLDAARILLLQALLVLATLVAARLLGDRLVPSTIRRARAREAAARAFWTRGLDRTRGRTGVLVYVSAAERYVDIIADRGIAARVPDGAWRETVAALAQDLARGEAAAGLVAAVGRIGAILAEHAPPGEPEDELPNAVVID